jgi:EAL domain-containing protein (putative c-di-GMP-specific phosphodiesterase class I)
MTAPPEARDSASAEKREPGGKQADNARPGLTRDLRAQAARTDMAERRRITQKLRAALSEDGFVLHYQPKVHLKTGRVRGVEALIRLQHKRRGLILPAHFMPVAETSDIVNEIGAWALGAVCREAVKWPERFSVSLNVSHRQVRGGKLTKQVIEALSQSGLASQRLELELSEAALIDDSEDTSFALKAVRALGVGVALDEFGAGYGSLSVLRRMPLTTLKLDRSVLVGLRDGDHDAAILRAAIEAAHALGCIVVADGVETETQCRVLDQMGCDEAQGIYFSAPLPAGDLLSRLKP